MGNCSCACVEKYLCCKPISRHPDYPDMYFKGAKPRKHYGHFGDDAVYDYDSAEALLERLQGWEGRLTTLHTTYGVVGTLLMGIAIGIYMDTTSQNEAHHLDQFTTMKGKVLVNKSEGEGEAHDASVEMFYWIKILAAAMTAFSGVTSMMSTICVIMVSRSRDPIVAHRFFNLTNFCCCGGKALHTSISEFFNRICAIFLGLSICLLLVIIWLDSYMRSDMNETYYNWIGLVASGILVLLLITWYALEHAFSYSLKQTRLDRAARAKEAELLREKALGPVAGRDQNVIKDFEMRLARLRNGRTRAEIWQKAQMKKYGEFNDYETSATATVVPATITGSPPTPPSNDFQDDCCFCVNMWEQPGA